jgi:hypothetical protein
MMHQPLDSLLEKLNSGDPAAVEKVFLAFEPYLRMVVRKKLSARLRAKFDSMDVVQSVWADVLRGFREAELAQRMLALCAPAHPEIVRFRMRGVPVAEIATRTGMQVGSAHRILQDLACRVALERKPFTPMSREATYTSRGQR